jgi:outer membrane protein assembly factor BamB
MATMRMIQKVMVLAVAAGLGIASINPARAAEPWPRFRGPNGTGVANDKDVPVRWSKASGLLWKTPVPGSGNSSPITWADRVFLQTAGADGNERMLLCFHVNTGKVLWSRAVPGSGAHTHPKNTLASSTPATDGERIYAIFWDGKDMVIFAYDLDGKPLWNRNLGSFTSQHGAGVSPIVFEGKVFISDDQDGSARLTALDARNGKLLWEKDRPAFRACYSTPLILTEQGHAAQLLVASTAGVTSYDPNSGVANWTHNWTFPIKPLRTVASPIYADGMIIASSGDGDGSRHTIAIKATGSEDGAGSHPVWEQSRTLPYVPTMLATGGHVYFVNDLGLAGCLVAKTGQTVWTQRLGGNFSASPILVDGKIYAANENGTVFVFPASSKFELLAKNEIGEAVVATPAVCDNRLLIRGQAHLFCIGKPADRRAAQR